MLARRSESKTAISSRPRLMVLAVAAALAGCASMKEFNQDVKRAFGHAEIQTEQTGKQTSKALSKEGTRIKDGKQQRLVSAGTSLEQGGRKRVEGLADTIETASTKASESAQSAVEQRRAKFASETEFLTAEISRVDVNLIDHRKALVETESTLAKQTERVRQIERDLVGAGRARAQQESDLIRKELDDAITRNRREIEAAKRDVEAMAAATKVQAGKALASGAEEARKQRAVLIQKRDERLTQVRELRKIGERFEAERRRLITVTDRSRTPLPVANNAS